VKIVHLSLSGDIRIVKETVPLFTRGWNDIHCITCNPIFSPEIFASYSRYQTRDQLINLIRLHANTDLWHVHATPYYHVGILRSILPKAKILLDAGDTIIQIIDGYISQDEVNNAFMADGFVFNTSRIRDEFFNVLDLDPKLYPNIILENRVPEAFYSEGMDEIWIGGVLYQGGLTASFQYNEKQNFNDFYNLEETFKALMENGISVVAYTYPNKETLDHYNRLGVHAYKQIPYAKLMERMPSFEYGLLGNVRPTRVWDLAMPNKLFDYIAAGLPILALKTKTAGAFVEKHGLGISCDTVEEFVSIRETKSWRDYKRTLMEHRYEFSMDKTIDTLTDLYETLC